MKPSVIKLCLLTILSCDIPSWAGDSEATAPSVRFSELRNVDSERAQESLTHDPKPRDTPRGLLLRRATLGAQLAPVTKEIRERQQLKADGGLVLTRVLPGTSAADSNLKAGDIILSIGETTVTEVTVFQELVAKAGAGSVLTIKFVRDGVSAETRVALKEMPREQGDGYNVVYSSVPSRGARLRTIVTHPKKCGRHPAVLMLQGGTGCFPVDDPFGQPTGFVRIAKHLAKHGYVTMRIERPGCGDSEGGPLRDVDFHTELDGYKQALRALAELDFVDEGNVFVFGHSQGGINAPLIAIERPVRGIVVFGTVSNFGIEPMLGQRRRLAMLDGTEAAKVEEEVVAQARFWYPLLVEKQTPLEILEQDSKLSKRVWEQWVTDEEYVGSRHYSFFHQVAALNLAKVWSQVAATPLPGKQGDTAKANGKSHPRVLAIWGTADWLVDRSSSAWIAEVVNRAQPGSASFVALDSIDHFYFRADSPQESYRYFRPAKGGPYGNFNPSILETLRAWLDETSGSAKTDSESLPDP